MSTYTIYDGDVSSGLNLTWGDSVILSGGTAVETTLSDYASMSILLEGLASKTVVNSGGVIRGSNGILENTTINSGGSLYAAYYLSATDIEVNNSGRVTTYALDMNNVTVNSGGRVEVLGGTVTSAFINADASMSLANTGALANNTVISGAGYNTAVSVSNRAQVSSTDVTSGRLLLSSGCEAHDTVLNGNGIMNLSSGASAFNTTINEGGVMSMAGGVADLVNVNFGGVLSADFPYGYTGGEYEPPIGATRVVENGGFVSVGSSSISSNRYVPGFGYFYTYTYVPFPVEFEPNSFSDLVYSNGARGTVHSGTTASNISTVNGGLTVFSGGIVNGFTIKPVTWESAFQTWQTTSHLDEETGEMVYENNPVVNYEEVTTLGSLTVHSGGIVTGLDAESIPGNDEYYSTWLNFEIARNTTINGTIDGVAFDLNNGLVSHTAVKNASMTYMSGAFAYDVTQTNGSAVFQSATYAKDMTFSGGRVLISRGAAVDGLTTFAVPYTYTEYGWGPDPEETVIETSSGANVVLLAGATVTSLNMDSVSYLTMEVAPDTILNGTSDGVMFDLKDGYFGGVSLNNTYVNVLGPSAYIDEVTDETVFTGAGAVGNLTVNNGAVVSAHDGSTALNMTENGGAVYVGPTDEPTVTYSFNSNMFSNDHLEGLVTVHKNTVAQDNIMYGGGLTVYSGGIVNNFYTVAGMGMGKGMQPTDVQFLSGAIVSNFDMVRYSEQPHHPGSAYFESGVKATHVRITDFDGIGIGVSPDTVIIDGAVDNIPFSVENGVLSGFHGDADGWYSDDITVKNGGRMIDCFVKGYGQITLENGAYAGNLTDALDYLIMQSGSLAEDVTIGLTRELDDGNGGSYVDYESASVNVRSGAVLRNFSVSEFSRLDVERGGKLTGVMRFDEMAMVGLQDGVTVDFDLTDPSALSVARTNSLSPLYIDFSSYSNTSKFTITIGAEQAAGTYVLAEEAYTDNNMTFHVVGTDGTEYGYFLGAWEYEIPDDPSSERFVFRYYPDTAVVQPGYDFSLDMLTVEDPELGGEFYRLVFTVDSQFAPVDWLAAPTVTADEIRFTNQNVVLTISSDEAETTEFSLDNQTWMTCGDTFAVDGNGVFYFRVAAGGVYSDSTMFRVSNIDKVAPTATSADSMTADVEDSNVSLAWAEATDDFSGVMGYRINFWTDPAEVIYIDTPWNNAVLESLTAGTWNWTVQTYDYAGNLSEEVAGAQFVVTNGYIPVIDLPDFATGDFDGDGKAQAATISDAAVGTDVKIYADAALWGGVVLDPGWSLVGVGDFNGDGFDDLLRMNEEGYVVGEMSQGDGTFAAQVLNFKSPGWSILGTGDFNNNGTDDVLIANPTGASETVGLLGYWESGASWTLINGYSAEWECIATGDYNSDGLCDMLWRNSFVGDDSLTYNAYCTWLTEPSDGLTDWRMVSVANPADWDYLCSGDFNGDGANDIAMINEVGVVGIWGVENGWLSTWSILSAVNLDDWKLVGCDDFDGDGTDDIGWCSTHDGSAGYWQIEDKVLASWKSLGSLV